MDRKGTRGTYWGASALALTVIAAPMTVGGSAAAAPMTPAGLPVLAGAKKVQGAKGPGVKYARYRTAAQSGAVTQYYAGQLTAAGYRVSGPRSTASESVVYGRKGRAYAAVQAGGSGPTYFEVCTGTNRAQVNRCDSPSGAS